jgi:hypothetical protein
MIGGSPESCENGSLAARSRARGREGERGRIRIRSPKEFVEIRSSR